MITGADQLDMKVTVTVMQLCSETMADAMWLVSKFVGTVYTSLWGAQEVQEACRFRASCIVHFLKS